VARTFVAGAIALAGLAFFGVALGAGCGTSRPAGADGGAGACASAFCADFDDGDLARGWTALKNSADAGTFTLDELFAASPPRSAKIAIGATSPDCADVRLERTFSASVRVAELQFAVRLGDADGGSFSGTTVAELSVSLGESSEAFVLELDPDGALLQERHAPAEGGASEFFPLPRIPTSTWAHVDLVIDLTSRVFSLRVDGKKMIDATALPTPLSGPGDGAFVALGASCLIQNVGPNEMRFDDVIVGLTP
jgi:hypothetical protein